MNSEPCVRFGIRISPKIREKPADNRNSRLPKVMLLTDSSQKFISAVFRSRRAVIARGDRCFTSAFAGRRIIARIDRMRQEVLLRPGPELADVLVSLDRLVPEIEAVGVLRLLDAAHVERADDITEMVEADRPARRVLE